MCYCVSRTVYGRTSYAVYSTRYRSIFACCSGFRRISSLQACMGEKEKQQQQKTTTTTKNSNKNNRKNKAKKQKQKQKTKLFMQLRVVVVVAKCYKSLVVDIDECADNTAGCSQICTNNGGSFTCSCRPGYLLGTNRKTCYGMSST